MFTQNPSKKQLVFIASLFKPDNSETIKALYEKIPRNNKHYIDKGNDKFKPDFRRVILEDAISEQFTSAQASLFIQCLQPGGDKKILVKLFNQLKF